MKNEFIKNDNIISTIDRFLFYDGEWLFAENKDYMINILDNSISVDDFISLGKSIAEKMNIEKVSNIEYDINLLKKYIEK